MSDGDVTAHREQRPFRAGDRVGVLVPLPLSGTYDYRVPEGLDPACGSIVEVPFGGRSVIGVVWREGDDSVPPERLKAITRVFQGIAVDHTTRHFVESVAEHTVHPPGAVLRMVLSVPDAVLEPRTLSALVLARPQPAGLKLTTERRRVLALAADGPPQSASDLARRAAVGHGVVRGLIAAGALVVIEAAAAPRLPAFDFRQRGPELSPSQADAAAMLRRALGAGFSASVLDGVPGSGKTEVYFEAIATACEQGRQTLVLLPEIALSAQWLARFHARFGIAPAVWHSDLRHSQRRQTWRRVAEGRVSVLVGARSALFLPFPNLGLIVVDEEHDASYKQDDGVAYHARDMAVVRARTACCPVILVSATPSLETIVNVREGRYLSLHLPDRFGGASLPRVEVVDLRRYAPPRGAWLSPPLREALAATLQEGSQSLLFLNRRGYAPLTLCRACGHRLRCANCSAWLVEHRRLGRLLCHHCGFCIPLPSQCPACGAADSLASCGPGVERLAEEVRAQLPDARLVLATSDTLTGPDSAAELVRLVESHAVDILIGTQILAKGYHFPMLTLVGIVDADLGLCGGDLRAAERTFQLLTQVAGRAGRADRPGRAILQSALPEHPVIKAIASQDRDAFLAAEEADRREAGMPPFGRLAALIVSAADEPALDAAAAALARQAPTNGGVRVLGPAPAPLALLRGRYRRRFLLIGPRRALFAPLIRGWLGAVRLPASIRVQIDVDPVNFS